MFTFRNIDDFVPLQFEKVGMLKGKRWYAQTKEKKKGLFKPKRYEFKDRKVFCANHYGEMVGGILGERAKIETCKSELAHHSHYYSNIYKERAHATTEEKDGCIIYSQLSTGDTLEAGKIVIDRFKESNENRYQSLAKNSIYRGKINDDIELILLSVSSRVEKFYKMGGNYLEKYIQSRIYQTKKKFIEMVVYDCLYGNYDRHEGNWSMHLHSNEEIDIYPLYDNERVLGLYENQNFIEKMLIEKEPEQIMDKIFFSRMRVPGEKKEFSTYKDMLRYLMYAYPEETQETLKRQLDSNTVQSTTSCLEQCEGLPDPYIEFGARMYEYRNRFARRLLEHNINQDHVQYFIFPQAVGDER